MEMMKLKLNDVLEALEGASDDTGYVLDMQTGEIHVFFDDDFDDFDDPEEAQEEIEEGSDRYLALPDSFDINEYEMMEHFLWTITDEEARHTLDVAMRGKGAFRRFSAKLNALGLEEDWYDYRSKQYERIARDWCEVNNIEIEE